MRLLLITDYFVPHRGGTAIYYSEIARRLTQFDVTVLTRRSAMPRPNSDVPVRVVQTPFPPIPKIRMLVEFCAQFLTGVRFVLRHRVRLILAGQVYPMGLAVYAVHLVTKVPFAVFVHGEELTKLTARRPLRAVLRVIFGRAGAVFAANMFSARLVSSLGVPADRICVVHPAVDLSQLHPTDGTAFRVRQGATHKKVLLTVGRLIPRKGQDTLIRLLPAIAREVPDVVYWIAGSGPAGSRERLEALARQHAVEDRVVFVGNVPPEQMAQLYSACDVFVMLNRTMSDGDVEGFGMVLLEANACGKPVIAGRSGGTSEAIQHGHTGLLIREGDDDAAQSACIQLLKDAQLRDLLGANGRGWVREHFSWERTASRVAAVSHALAVGDTSLNKVPAMVGAVRDDRYTTS